MGNEIEHKIVRIKEKKIYKEKFCFLTTENRFLSNPLPGQFIHIRIESVFLRRPFSIAEFSSKTMSIFFQLKGKGTSSLSQKNRGENIDVIGPVGNSFPYERFKENILVVAGGIGIAPMIFLSSELLKTKKKFSFFHGAQNKNSLLNFFLPEGISPVIISTDDGSKGKKGKITDILEDYLKKEKVDVIFASGPYFMLKKTAEISTRFNIPCYVSMENRMFCGTGVCQGCVIETKDGFQKVCTDGPVFDAEQIRWKDIPYA
ncbi:MAG: dihydroorotate dehydrogenase electron transfer subunit [Candidatus Omnitrophica bacterium]|nr:dihydroorotate dehydrogenase electron transfer subunit [Candidatus Omnitrophota bacterium]